MQDDWMLLTSFDYVVRLWWLGTKQTSWVPGSSSTSSKFALKGDGWTTNSCLETSEWNPASTTLWVSRAFSRSWSGGLKLEIEVLRCWISCSIRAIVFAESAIEIGSAASSDLDEMRCAKAFLSRSEMRETKLRFNCLVGELWGEPWESEDVLKPSFVSKGLASTIKRSLSSANWKIDSLRLYLIGVMPSFIYFSVFALCTNIGSVICFDNLSKL